jgi:hypothetical protein
MNECRLANGKIVEEWEIVNELEIMRQLGLTDAPAGAEETPEPVRQ